MVENTEKEQASWNLSQAIITELAGLLQSASRCFVAGLYNKALVNLEAIRMRIAYYLSPEERKEFREMEQESHLILNKKKALHDFDMESRRKWLLESQPKIHVLLDKYNEKIMFCLKQSGLLIPQKEDKTRMLA